MKNILDPLLFLEGRANFLKEKFHLNPAAHTANAASKSSKDYASCIND